jgi:hypothetical protein
MPMFFLGILILIPILFLALVNFDRLVKSEFHKHKPQWIKDGKPGGFFWRPYESTFILSALATKRLSFSWLFKTPQWVDEDPEARESLKKLRLFVLLWNVGVILWFVSILIVAFNS